MTGRIHVKHSGAWQVINKLNLKHRGVWKDPKGGWVKYEGFWYQVYPWDPSLRLDLDFLAMDGVLDPRISVFRSRHMAYMAKNGLYTIIPHNYAAPSEDFFHSSFSKMNGCSISANITTGPTGTLTADRLNHQTAGVGNGGYLQWLGPTQFIGYRGILSIYAKMGSKKFLWLYSDNGGNSFAYFNLETGVPGARTGPSWISSGMQDVGNGWYRCWALSAGRWSYTYWGIAETDGSLSCSGPGDIYLWGLQLEHVTQATTPADYIPTIAADGVGVFKAPRFEWDPLTHEPLGLLVEHVGGRNQNYQNDFSYTSFWYQTLCTILADQAISPDGVMDADLMTATNFPSTIHGSTYGGIGRPYVNSFYCKKTNNDWVYIYMFTSADAPQTPRVWFNLANGTVGIREAPLSDAGIEDVGNGWWRCWTTRMGIAEFSARHIGLGLADGNGSNVTTPGQSVLLWGGQFETAGTYPLSPIIVTDTTASGDTYFMKGTNVTDWYNASGGTFFIDFVFKGWFHEANHPLQTIFRADDGVSTSSPGYTLWLRDGDILKYEVSGGAVDGALGVLTRGRHKLAVTYSLNNFKACLDGGPVFLDKTGTLPVGITRLLLGCYDETGAGQMNAHIRRFQYYAADKTADEIQAMTRAYAEDMFLEWLTDALDTSPTFEFTYAGKVGDQHQLQVDTDPAFGSPSVENRTVSVETNNTTVQMGSTITLVPSFTYSVRVKRTRGAQVDYSNIIRRTIIPAGTAWASWSPTDKAPGITLSSNNNIATITTSGVKSVRSKTARDTGKVHVEFRYKEPPALSGNYYFGLANSLQSLGSAPHTGLNSIVFYAYGQTVYRNSASQGPAFILNSSMISQAWYAMEIDFAAQTIKFNNGWGWGASYSFSGISGPYYLLWSGDPVGESCEINGGRAPWAITPSTDYTGWDAGTAIAVSITTPTSLNANDGVMAVATIEAASDLLVTWSLVGGADQAMFYINPATGALSFTSPPEFETPIDANGDNVYVVHVRAADPFTSDTEIFNVTVLNLPLASYANPGGTGNRVGSITVTTTSALAMGTINALIDGAIANTMYWNGSQSGREVKFDFGTPKLITEAKWYQPNVYTHGDWKWQGSNDNSVYTDIGGTFTLGSSATTVITTLAANVTLYRYYKMLQVSGTTSSGPYLQEIEFKIG